MKIWDSVYIYFALSLMSLSHKKTQYLVYLCHPSPSMCDVIYEWSLTGCSIIKYSLFSPLIKSSYQSSLEIHICLEPEKSSPSVTRDQVWSLLLEDLHFTNHGSQRLAILKFTRPVETSVKKGTEGIWKKNTSARYSNSKSVSYCEMVHIWNDIWIAN